MVPKFQYGIVITANTPNLPDPGGYYRPWKEKPPFEKCSKCAAALNLSEKIEHLIHGWILVSLHYLLQNIRIIHNFTIILIRLQ